MIHHAWSLHSFVISQQLFSMRAGVACPVPFCGQAGPRPALGSGAPRFLIRNGCHAFYPGDVVLVCAASSLLPSCAASPLLSPSPPLLLLLIASVDNDMEHVGLTGLDCAALDWAALGWAGRSEAGQRSTRVDAWQLLLAINAKALLRRGQTPRRNMTTMAGLRRKATMNK